MTRANAKSDIVVAVAFALKSRIIHAMPGAGKTTLVQRYPELLCDTDELLRSIMSEEEFIRLKRFGPRPESLQKRMALAVSNVLSNTKKIVITNFWSRDFVINLPKMYLSKNHYGLHVVPISFQISPESMEKRKEVPLKLGVKWTDDISQSFFRPSSCIFMAGNEYISDYVDPLLS